MRKPMILLMAALMVVVGLLSWAEIVSAQNKNSNGIGYFALEVPNQGRNMTIDAKADDWLTWFDPSYVIDKSQMLSTVQFDMPTAEDWDAIFMVGYTPPPDNMWYVFVRVTDDWLNADTTDPDRGFVDDDVEFSTDMDNSGGPFPDRTHAQQWTFHLPQPGGFPVVAYLRYQLPPEMQWGTKSPYCESAAAVDPPGSGHLARNVTVTYEWKIAAWNNYQPGGPDASTRHIFQAGETVNTVVQVNEADDVDWENQIGTCSDNRGGNGSDASVMSTFTMLPIGEYTSPTAVEAKTWGVIKALMKNLR
jgi:hypothetical protein